MRLQRALSEAGIASRRRSEDLIRAGRVHVNGRLVTQMGLEVDPAKDEILVDGRSVAPPARRVVYLLHKPVGRVTTRSDERGRPTVMDLVPDVAGLHPVGRLDLMTSGLLILTNDGNLTHALTHPSHEVTKVYRARVSGQPSDGALRRMAAGLELEDGMTAPCEVVRVGSPGHDAVLEIRIHEGRNRQVRRMCAAIGHPVRSLVRLAIGPIRLDDLGEGCWREPRSGELEWLRQCVDGSQRT